MTVAELIERLTQYPQELTVVISSDGEGNDFNEVSDISTGEDTLTLWPY